MCAYQLGKSSSFNNICLSTYEGLHVGVQVSGIRQEHHQPSTAKASTSHSTPSPPKQQVHVKLPNSIRDTIPADMVLWTAGSSPASHTARKSKLPFDTNQKGALLTDGNLQVLKQQRVFALGDVAGADVEAETANIPPTAQVSLSMLSISYHMAIVL